MWRISYREPWAQEKCRCPTGRRSGSARCSSSPIIQMGVAAPHATRHYACVDRHACPVCEAEELTAKPYETWPRLTVPSWHHHTKIS